MVFLLFTAAVKSFIICYNSWFFFYDFYNKTNNYATVYYLLTLGLFLICLALKPNLNEDNVYAWLSVLGDTLIIKWVLELPPKLSCSNRVSLESLYGTCYFFYEVRALITFPRADKDLLIFFASSNCCPTTPVLPTF